MEFTSGAVSGKAGSGMIDSANGIVGLQFPGRSRFLHTYSLSLSFALLIFEGDI